MVRASVGSVRRAVAEHVGSKVKVRSNLGRHKYDVTEGVITETYPAKKASVSRQRAWMR